MSESFDLIIVGGGVVGLATAMKATQNRPGIRVALIEKEKVVGFHQTSHNSGVIHSGIYYKPGSLKAKNCVAGYQKLLEFCDQQEVPYEICGKIIVATRESELGQLQELERRGKANGLSGLQVLSSEGIREKEPYCTGIRGLWVPQTGIISFQEVAKKYAEVFTRNGGRMFLGEKVTGMRQGPGQVEIVTEKQVIITKKLVTCGGLHSDRLARHTEQDVDFRITPFRGEYYKLKPSAKKLVKNLIYPVPDPAFPFLGVHFTRMTDGAIECGPNAVLAFKREGYRKTDFSLHDTYETFAWAGFRKVAARYWRSGIGEFYRSISKAAFTRALQRLIPELNESDLEVAEAGVRAQACSRDGALLDDFHIFQNGPVVHVCNAPSPAATSSLAVGETILDRIYSN